jgi:hypothetical protein
MAFRTSSSASYLPTDQLEFDELGIPKRPQRVQNLTMESEFLQQKVIAAKGGGLITQDPRGYLVNNQPRVVDQMLQSARYHTCDHSCRFDTLKEGLFFRWKDNEYVASGIVFVCHQTSLTHVCGIKHCYTQIRDPNGAGMICSTTGLWLAREESLRQHWTDADIRIIGNQCFDFFGGHENDIDQLLERERRIERVAFIEEEDEDKRERQERFTSDFVLEELKMETNNRKQIPDQQRKSVRESNFFEKALKEARNIERTVWSTLEVYPREKHTDLFLLKKIHERAIFRQQALEIWDAIVMSKKYVAAAKEAFDKNTAIWLENVQHYIRNCVEQRKRPEQTHSIYMWIRDVMPTLKDMYYGFDVDALKAANETFMVECMIKVWEMYKDLDIILKDNIQFVSCATAILKGLAAGVRIELFLLDEDPKPRHGGNLSAVELKRAKRIELQIIKPHHQVILASTTAIRRMYPTQYKSGAHSKGVPVNNMVTGRRGAGCRTKTPTQRKVRQPSCLMPAQKLFHLIIRGAVDESKTIDEFIEKYIFPF